jgi:hypothetical protein
MRIKKLALFLFTGILILSVLPQNLGARIYIDIDAPSGRKLPIAIVSLKILDESITSQEAQVQAPLFNQFRAILERDLRMSGLFTILSSDSFLESGNVGITTSETQFSLWRKTGADALVKGGIHRKGNSYSLEIRLFDVQQESRAYVRR